MHDVDRTLREFEAEAEFGGQEVSMDEAETQQGFLGSILGSLMGQGEQEQSFLGEAEIPGELEGFLGETQEAEGFLGETERGGVFDEVQEMELAAELLEVSNEQELEYFLGKLISTASRAIGSIARSPIGQALGPALKKIAKTALPIAGAALGNFVLPGVGGALGGKLASAAGNLFGLELEGLSPQDREFEVARRFVRLGGAATQRAMRLPPNLPVQRVVRSALITAARKHAPGLLQPRANLRRPVGRPYGYRRPGPGIPRPPYRAPATGGVYVAPSFTTPSYVPDATNYANGGPGYAPDYGTGDAYGYGSATPSYTRSGRWVRRGRKIVLFGV
ncbi:MAG TPA: hypothetical protein VGR07_00875 [Thermoanaerobaculia bacterium]|jgi:hypothetical protein|nr:hypothetical protein [Thermoanaerobaculia bacterium]